MMRGAALAALLVALGGCAATPQGSAQGNKAGSTAPGEIASGTFKVKITPIADAPVDAPAMRLAKTFHGALEGTSSGTMLTAGDPASGSAGYVAMERFTGTLAGRPGSFSLQHSGTMDAGQQTLAIAIVPGSGEGELVGIAGTMTITIADGVHGYRLQYALHR